MELNADIKILKSMNIQTIELGGKHELKVHDYNKNAW